MQPKHETAHYGDLPTPQQLDRLNAQLIMFANRHDKLYIKDTDIGRKKYYVKPTIRFERPDIMEGAPLGYLLRESLGAMATRDTLDRSWSLRVFSNFEAIEYGSQRGGERTTYSFEWNDHDVKLATRKMVATPDRHPEELIDVIDTLSMPEDVAFVPTMEAQTRYVDPFDLEYLMGEMAMRMSPVDSGAQEYRERRKDRYMDYFAN